jgi:hypothetical protein
VTYRLCHRCHAELPPHDEGNLIFCSHCGAPLVVLSEELLTQAEELAGADGTAAPPAPDARSQVWRGAIRCAGLSGAITAAIMLLSLLVPSAVLLTIFWVVISPVVVIGIFQARNPLAPMTPGFGARLGLLTGLSNGIMLSVGTTTTFVIARFGLHAMGPFDKQLDMVFAQTQERMGAQSPADIAAISKICSLPEFRAGTMLASAAFGILLLLAITTLGGAFAGFARSRARA